MNPWHRWAYPESPDDLSFIADSTVTLKANHSVDGNPMRFKVGELTLRVDNEWRTALPRRQRAIVTALTWPLLARYGYLRLKRRTPASS